MRNTKQLIVVLTQNRPKILKRCLEHSLVKTTQNANWLIIDDSSKNFINQNYQILRYFTKKGLIIYHVTNTKAKKLGKDLFLDTFDKYYKITFGKNTCRDISGLRNLALLFSLVLKPKITYFVDDDVVPCVSSYNNSCFFDLIEKNYKHKKNFIVGSTLGGILDESYSGRINYLCKFGKKALREHEVGVHASDKHWNFSKHPLWIEPMVNTINRNPKYASAGLLAIKINDKSIIPFPIGYNEDWVWCILQSMLYKTKIFVQQSESYHSPPKIIRPDHDGLTWEQKGDIIFDSIFSLLGSKVTTIGCLRKKIKQTTIILETLQELADIRKCIGKLLKQDENAGINSNLSLHDQEIEDLIKVVRKLDYDEFFSFWLNNLRLRKKAFSIILNKKDIRTQITSFISDVVVR